MWRWRELKLGKGISADVEQCPRLKAVFYIPSLQDVAIMLFFQFVSFLSKGFNVLIFLFQLWIVVAGTKLKLFNLLFQLAYLFFICLSFFRVSLSIIVVREVPSSFYILIYIRMAWELGSNGLISQVFDEVQEVR